MSGSQARRRARTLHQEIEALFETLLGRCAVFPGSLYEHKSQCGKANCRCATGPYRHRLWCLSFLEEGRSCTRVVPKAIRPAVGSLTNNYRRFRRARQELHALLSELTLRLHGAGGFGAYPYVVHCGGLIDALTPEHVEHKEDEDSGRWRTVVQGFNHKNVYARTTPCDKDLGVALFGHHPAARAARMFPAPCHPERSKAERRISRRHN